MCQTFQGNTRQIIQRSSKVDYTVQQLGRLCSAVARQIIQYRSQVDCILPGRSFFDNVDFKERNNENIVYRRGHARTNYQSKTSPNHFSLSQCRRNQIICKMQGRSKVCAVVRQIIQWHVTAITASTLTWSFSQDLLANDLYNNDLYSTSYISVKSNFNKSNLLIIQKYLQLIFIKVQIFHWQRTKGKSQSWTKVKNSC